MTKEEIKYRQLNNQHLLVPVSPEVLLTDLCGLQAQFFGNVLHSLKIRCRSIPGSAEAMMKNWTIRGTMHVFLECDLPMYLRCGELYRCNKWDVKSFWNQRSDWALTPVRQQKLSDVILQALANKDCTRDELKLLCREKGMTSSEEASMFHPWGGGIRELCERGFIHYAAQEDKVFKQSPIVKPLEKEQAELELARRYFTNFAPATIHDAMYFFRAPASQITKWLANLPVTSVDCEGKTYYYIDKGISFTGNFPDCCFLAGFDQLMLGYEKKESLYLRPENLRDIFNLAGIVMPALLLKGEVAGSWKEKNGILIVRPFYHLSDQEVISIKTEAEKIWPEIRKIIIQT